MKAVIQRTLKCSVSIDNNVSSSTDKGMLVLFCVEKDDTKEKVDWFVSKILSLRFFEDENGKMNKSVTDVNGDIMVVSQFTLAADCKKGTRPSFDKSEKPEIAKLLYEYFVDELRKSSLTVETGEFGAMMSVSLVNDGPVTFVLER